MPAPARPVLSATLFAAALACACPAHAQVFSDADDARHALSQAQSAGAEARTRAEKLEAEAAGATQAVERTVREAAAVAARIQQDEADIAAAEARVRLIDAQRARFRASLAERQRPLVRLTAALQRLSRRPLAIALFRPGSVADAVHTRALIATMIPEVRRRTASLRAEIARGIVLQQQARAAQAALRDQQKRLAARQQVLVGLETRQRLAARDMSGSADREAERALALAEQARDLGSLADTLGEAASLRQQLAALPGPVLRPDHEAGAAPADIAPPAQAEAPHGYQLPASGRLVGGYGNAGQGAISRGITFAVRPGAQVVSPAAGRIAFAGAFRGYGDIVIIAHEGNWTSLVTGMARLDVRVGDAVVGGSPLGIAGPGRPVLGLELRHDSAPVNPLELLGRH